MSQQSRGLKAIVLSAIALCIVASLTGAGAEQEKTAVQKYAVVDSQKVLSGYRKSEELQAKLQAQQTDMRQQLRVYQQNPLLDQNEQSELADLTVKEQHNQNALSNAETQRKQQLVGKSKTMQDDYELLKQKPTAQMTPQEQDKLRADIRLATDTDARLQQVTQQKQAQLQKMADDAVEQLKGDIRTAIGKVAHDKGYTAVFSSEICLAAEGDITNEVLASLNK